jgi:uncharacterized protein YybS (DUF2232 family)
MPLLSHFRSKNALLDTIKGSAATVALFLAYVLLMFAGPLAGIFAPFPVLYYALKSGRCVGIAIVITAVGILFVLSPAGALFYLFQCGVFALLLAEFLVRGKGVIRTITYTIAINLLAILVFALIYSLWQGVDANGLVIKGIHIAITQAEAFYQKSGLKGEDLEVMRKGLEQAADFTGKAYPALLVVFLGFIAALNLMLLKKIAHKLPRQLFFDDFTVFKNPDQLIWVLIVAGFSLLVNDALVTKTALNILIVTMSLYFIQGLSITAYFFKRLPVPGFLRALFYIMLVIQPYLTVAVAAFGIMDLWCNFRTPKKQENL